MKVCLFDGHIRNRLQPCEKLGASPADRKPQPYVQKHPRGVFVHFDGCVFGKPFGLSGCERRYHETMEKPSMRKGSNMDVTAILFEGFETLDIFGPVEMLGASGEFQTRFFSVGGGVVKSYQGVPVQTEPLDEAPAPQVLIVPGGMGVYAMLEDEAFISKLAELSSQATYVLSVCNGAFLYAKAGVLDGRRATTYKARIDKAEELFPSVRWERNARWTVDGNCYVSSGVSAGTDMALGFIADVCGRELAEKTATYAEYTWNSDPANDPFAR